MRAVHENTSCLSGHDPEEKASAYTVRAKLKMTEQKMRVRRIGEIIELRQTYEVRGA